MDAIPEKPAAMPAEDHEQNDHEVEDDEENEQESRVSSLRSSLETIWFTTKFLFLGFSGSYLTSHWFDHFCYPWSFDSIMTGTPVPYALAVGIVGGSIAWAWWSQGFAGLRRTCSHAGILLFLDGYVRPLDPEAKASPFFAISIFTCVVLVLLALFGDRKIELEQGDDTSATSLRENTEAAREIKSAVVPDAPSQASHVQSHVGFDSRVRGLASRLQTIHGAFVVATIATLSTFAIHPPETVTSILSVINCEAHCTRLPRSLGNNHIEFTTTNRNMTLARHCSQPQQEMTLSDAMWEHIETSKATCGVSCLRRTESGGLVGYISEVNYGLVDMHYCRGEYESFGPGCEAEGENYGYDVSREGWMNDVGSQWSAMNDWLMSGVLSESD